MRASCLQKIVSGGQTGVDRGALDAALKHGFPCGGWAPEHGMAEDGEIPGRYSLTRMERGGYRRRTVQNILDSDGTVILYCGVIEGGTELTLDQCIRKKKPYWLIDGREVAVERAAELLAEFVAGNKVGVLNVAGSRASKWPQAHEYARSVVG